MQNRSLYLNYPVLHLICQGCDLKDRTTGMEPRHYMVEGGLRSRGGGGGVSSQVIVKWVFYFRNNWSNFPSLPTI